MYKFIAIPLALALFSTSVSALADDLEYEMKRLGDTFKTVEHTTDPFKLTYALKKMREIAVKSKALTPEKLVNTPKDGEELKAYQAGIEELIQQIDTSIRLVDVGDTAGMNQAIEELKKIRQTNHARFR